MSAPALVWLNGAAAVVLIVTGVSYVLLGGRLQAAIDRDRRDGLGTDGKLDRPWYEFTARTWGFILLGLGLLSTFFWVQS